MPAVIVTVAVVAKRRDSVGSGLGTGSRLASAVKLRAAEAGTEKAQGSGVAGSASWCRRWQWLRLRQGRRSEKPGLGYGSLAAKRALRMLGSGKR